MPKMATKAADNVFYKARMEASSWNERLSSREGAAEETGLVFAALVIFTVEMIREFRLYGSIPDTLCTCVFAALGGECGIMGWIKTTKERKREREYELEDREEEKRERAGGESPDAVTTERTEEL